MEESGAFNGHVGLYQYETGNDLLARATNFYAWQQERRQLGVWPYSKSNDGPPLPVSRVRTDSGQVVEGINLAQQDYLGLCFNKDVVSTAVEAANRWGVHSAGSAILLGNTASSLQLEEKLSEFLRVEEVVLFPTGWAAGYGVIRALVREDDYVLLDEVAHACLQEGARVATPQVRSFRHLDMDALKARLHSIRSKDTTNGILVVTEGLFSMDSDAPDLRAMQDICSEFNATLLVDVAHDLGSLGENGGGTLEIQGMLGKVDIVMGSFSKTFASNGGFVGCKSRAIKEYIKTFSNSHTFSNALSPIQSSVVLKCIDIVRSTSGAQLRRDLQRNAEVLRTSLVEGNVKCLGIPSAIVPAMVDDLRIGRLVSRRLEQEMLVTNLVEYPGVPIEKSRLRLQIMASHTTSQLRSAASVISQALLAARGAI